MYLHDLVILGLWHHSCTWGLGKYFYVSSFKHYGREDIRCQFKLKKKVETLFHVKEKNVDR